MTLLRILFFFSINSLFLYSENHFRHVYFSMLHQPLYNFNDSGFSGLSKLSALLLEDGIQLKELQDINILETIQATSACLFIGPYTSPYHNSLISKSIDKFIRNGGMLLVIGEHDNLAKLNSYQNEILKPYGLQFSTQAWSDSELWPTATSTMNSLKARIYYPTVVKGGKSLLKFKTYNLACSKLIEKGKVVAIGDAEWLWNMNSVHGIEEENNYLFLRDLLKTKKTSSHHKPHSILEKLLSNYENINLALNPKRLSKAHKKHIIIFTPKTYLGNQSNQEGLVKAVRKMKFFDHLTYTIPDELKSSINLQKGILAEEKQQAKISFKILNNNTLRFHSSPLSIKNHNNMDILLKSKEDIKHFYNLIPTVSDNGIVTFDALEKKSSINWSLIIKMNDFFIFTSKSLISDTFFKTSDGKHILNHLKAWVKN